MGQEELMEKCGYWCEHPVYPVDDWKGEIFNDYTRLGYWAWCAAREVEEQEEK